ncbi:MAG: glycosyltransferase, partial [Bacteroidota bacterium]
PGWTSLMLTILFLGGVQLISIGIIGEYISRLGNNIRKRPLYVVSDTNISTFSSSALGKQEH